MTTTQSHEFGQVLANLLIGSGYVRKNYSPDWIRFASRVPGVGYETIRKAVTGERAVSADLMRRVAAALTVEPTVFAEYRLLLAKREFDPSEVGWDRATAALGAWEAARRASDEPRDDDQTT